MANSKSKTILITGCSKGGIGDALALSFHNRGHRVFATARDLSKISHLKDLGLATLQLDIIYPPSITACLEAVTKITNGTLDVLVNNSGAGYSTPILDADLDVAKKIMDVNFFGRVAVTQAFAPLLIKSKGMLLNIGSIAAVSPSPWAGMYNATCAAVHQWNDTLRIEMEPFGVRVVLVITGAVKTNFIANLPTTSLKEDSIYTPGKEDIEAVMNATRLKNNFVSVESFAEDVVVNALKPRPTKHLWAGGVAGTLWAVQTFLWATAWDLVLPGTFGINALKRNLKLAKKNT